VPDRQASYRNASDNFKFAAAVAEFGLLLRDSRYKGQSSYVRAAEMARASAGADLSGRRAEFVGLVEAAGRLAPRETASR
jgi:Ca-activated chloride channel family protein